VEAVEQRFAKAPISFMGGKESRRDAILRTVQGPFGFISLGTRLASQLAEKTSSFNPL
jgi:hypothetical protein